MNELTVEREHPTERELTFEDLDRQLAEQLPARELMGCCCQPCCCPLEVKVEVCAALCL